MKKVLIGILVFGLLGGLYFYNQYSKPVDKIEGLSSIASLAAADLFSEFEADEKAANTKYLDKVITVNGTVLSTEIKNDQASIFLETDDMLGTILCQLEKKPSVLPEKGASVAIKGVCSGYLTDVVLVRAMINK